MHLDIKEILKIFYPLRHVLLVCLLMLCIIGSGIIIHRIKCMAYMPHIFIIEEAFRHIGKP